MHLLFDIKDGIATMTLNRTDKFNSINRELALGIQARLEECMRNEEVRVVLFTGEGKAFCAGQDLAEATDPNAPSLRSIVHGHYNPIIEKIRTIEKPVVCAVNGVAAGAGANLALACDIVVAKESAVFIQAFSKIGLIPDSAGTFFLPRLIGMQKASALMMLADNISAKEAERLGMIYQYFPDEEFTAKTNEIVKKLSEMPTQALAYTKLALNESFLNSLSKQLALEEEFQHRCGETEDFEEGIAAFLEKRKPIFKGK